MTAKRLTALWWVAKSVATGHLYFEDGESERAGRGFVWDALRPRPLFWFAMHGAATRLPCGCAGWRFTHRPVMVQGNCPQHGLDALLRLGGGEGVRSDNDG